MGMGNIGNLNRQHKIFGDNMHIGGVISPGVRMYMPLFRTKFEFRRHWPQALPFCVVDRCDSRSVQSLTPFYNAKWQGLRPVAPKLENEPVYMRLL